MTGPAPVPRPWPAPYAPGPVDATVTLPGSKSLTARYLVLAALAEGPSVLRGALRARDTELMVAALRALGADITVPAGSAGRTSPGALRVAPAGPDVGLAGTEMRVEPGALRPAPAGLDVGLAGTEIRVEPGALRPAPAGLDVGLAGTVMRFVPAVAALAPGWTRFTGDAAAARRPIEPLLRALEQLGIAVQRTPGATLPFAVLGRRHLPGGSVTLDASASSQFLSALLLAAPRFTQGLAVRLEPARLPSRPHVAMTLAALRAFGASASEPSPDNNTWRVASGGLTGRDIGIEPDLTNAAPFLAAAVATGGTVRIEGWPATTTQAGALMLDYLMAFGATPTLTGGTLAVTGTGPIQGVDLDLADAGELAPTVAALAALATSASHLGGIGHLRGHETDRLAALACEINRLGGRAQVVADGLTIRPAPLHGAHLATYGDHRMAMFGAVAGLRVKGVVLEDIGVTTKTFPGFAAAWAGLV